MNLWVAQQQGDLYFASDRRRKRRSGSGVVVTSSPGEERARGGVGRVREKLSHSPAALSNAVAARPEVAAAAAAAAVAVAAAAAAAATGTAAEAAEAAEEEEERGRDFLHSLVQQPNNIAVCEFPLRKEGGEEGKKYGPLGRKNRPVVSSLP